MSAESASVKWHVDNCNRVCLCMFNLCGDLIARSKVIQGLSGSGQFRQRSPSLNTHNMKMYLLCIVQPVKVARPLGDFTEGILE